MARRRKERREKARCGRGQIQGDVGRGKARSAVVWKGKARQGTARNNFKVWSGTKEGSKVSSFGRFKVWLGQKRSGRTWLEPDWTGKEHIQGTERRAKAR